MAKLLIQRDGVSIQEATIQATATIGRLKDCTVQLRDPEISRVHALITQVAGGFLLTDKGSMNGTQVNGVKLSRGQEVMLNHGDQIRIMAFELRLDVGAGEAASVPAEVQPSTEMILAQLEKPPKPCVLLSHLLEDRAHQSVWTKGEVTLRVADIIAETADTKTFRLVGQSDTLFSYKPGQFVTMTVNIDGKPVKRSYSVSSSPSRPHTLELTIKRVPGGLVSNWMNDHVALGDEILVRGPAGKFSCFNYPSQKILCIAGGSGITPIMSMLRWIVDTAADVDVVLLYSGRSPADFIFRKELETMSARHNGLRMIFTVTSSWSGTESWTGLTGRCNSRMIDLVAPDALERHVFMCGPKPFSDAVKSELKCLNYPMANLHTESFGSGRIAEGTPVEPKQAVVNERPIAQPTPDPVRAPEPLRTPISEGTPTPTGGSVPTPPTPVEAAASFKVVFKTSSVEAQAQPDGNLLDLAENHGVEIDYACRQGSCGSCRTKCLSGDVTMEENDLSDEERAEGWIYPCVSCATSDVVLEV
ncbi:MAG: ferredoxin-NADP reductase/ferredoxin [Planctomycetota bacterium]|jgi:ferredoxin-NADP reductase/ferredoxin